MPTSLTHHVVWPLVLLLGQAKWARRLSAAAVKPRGVHLAVPSVPAIVGNERFLSRLEVNALSAVSLLVWRWCVE